MTKREETIKAIAHAIADGPNPSSATWQSAAAAFDAAIKVLMEPDTAVIDAAVWDHQKSDIALARGTAFAIWTDMLKAASA